MANLALTSLLEPPRYGFVRDGQLYHPSTRELLGEFFSRLDLFHSRKSWLPLLGWLVVLALGGALGVFLFRYFSWPLFALGFVYSMVGLGSHGTFYLHRYSTHRAFRFRNRFWRFVCQNLVIKIVPEEVYVVSHHVHHGLTEQPGDPYNVHGGWLYCFLADVNHQAIARDLDERGYRRLTRMLEHTAVRANSHAQYLKWGSICHPGYTALSYGLNWAFWYAAFWAVGGHALACALFGMSAVWAVGVRTFNFDGHGGGKDRRQPGIDFHRGDLSINQLWPGYVAGEWHNNHHLYPQGARSGFLPYQLDLPWAFIWLLRSAGVISWCRDPKPQFLEEHYRPGLNAAPPAGIERAPR